MQNKYQKRKAKNMRNYVYLTLYKQTRNVSYAADREKLKAISLNCSEILQIVTKGFREMCLQEVNFVKQSL